MPTARADLSFSREGLTLAQWLPRLIDPDLTIRNRAGEWLMAMHMGVDSPHNDIDESTRLPDDNHQAEFRRQVAIAISNPAFPARSFLTAAISILVGAQAQWLQHVKDLGERWTATDEQFDRVIARIHARLDADPSQANQDAQNRRLARALCASCGREERLDTRGAEAFSFATMILNWVVEASGPRLLEAPQAVWMLLDTKGQEYLADSALRTIGAPAESWSDHYLTELDATPPDRWFRSWQTLGSIGRGSHRVVSALIDRVRSAPRQVASGAAYALGMMPPDLAGLTDAAFAALSQRIDAEPDAVPDLLRAWASVGRTRPEVPPRIAQLIRPAPPRPRRHQRAPDWYDEYDLTALERGAAIDSVEFLPHAAPLLLPPLIDALDTFQEYDPDEGYHGDHARVCRAIASLGPAAAPAVPRLIALLPPSALADDGAPRIPNDVIETLGAIGPAASAALPHLDRLNSKCESRGDSIEEDRALAKALRAIRGTT